MFFFYLTKTNSHVDTKLYVLRANVSRAGGGGGGLAWLGSVGCDLRRIYSSVSQFQLHLASLSRGAAVTV